MTRAPAETSPRRFAPNYTNPRRASVDRTAQDFEQKLALLDGGRAKSVRICRIGCPKLLTLREASTKNPILRHLEHRGRMSKTCWDESECANERAMAVARANRGEDMAAVTASTNVRTVGGHQRQIVVRVEISRNSEYRRWLLFEAGP